MAIKRGSPHYGAVQRSRLSAVNSQIHVAATTLKQQKADLNTVDFSIVDEEQLKELRHAAVRAGTHARALLDAVNQILEHRS